MPAFGKAAGSGPPSPAFSDRGGLEWGTDGDPHGFAIRADDGLPTEAGSAEPLVNRLRDRMAPALPDRLPGLEIGHLYRPVPTGNGYGGDFYDLFPLGEGRYGILIGDVCGKGAGVAYLAAWTRHLVRRLTRPSDPPAAVLARVDRRLEPQLAEDQFVTAFYGVVDLVQDRLTCANAGHEPLLRETAGNGVAALPIDGMVMGTGKRQPFPEHILSFAAGDSLLLYTDGLTEARQGDAFLGERGVAELLRKSRGRPAPERVRSLEAALERFTEGPLHDDVALLLLHRPPGDRVTPGPSVGRRPEPSYR